MKIQRPSKLVYSVFASMALAVSTVLPLSINQSANAETYYVQSHCESSVTPYAYNQANNYSYIAGGFCVQSGSAYTVFQSDGNLITYVNGQPTWSTNTSGLGVTHMVLQGDGNIVVYANSTAVWSSGTAGQVGSGGNQVEQLSDGQFNIYAVTYGSNAKTQIW